MSVIKKMRKQTAVWWERLAADDFGKYNFAPGVEIACRWDDTSEEFRNTAGQTELSNSVVYVDREMNPGDKLRKGELESVTDDNPLDLTDAFEIKRFDKIPNFKATETLLVAYL